MAFVSNVDQWERDVLGGLDRIAADLERAFERLADDVEARQRADAPKPRTGGRAATIHQSRIRGRRRYVADVGPTVPAFSLVFDEFGARDTPAAPFLRPAAVDALAGWDPRG